MRVAILAVPVLANAFDRIVLREAGFEQQLHGMVQDVGSNWCEPVRDRKPA
jgi:hypothetical protein